jgi:hypothetical protein
MSPFVRRGDIIKFSLSHHNILFNKNVDIKLSVQGMFLE